MKFENKIETKTIKLTREVKVLMLEILKAGEITNKQADVLIPEIDARTPECITGMKIL